VDDPNDRDTLGRVFRAMVAGRYDDWYDFVRGALGASHLDRRLADEPTPRDRAEAEMLGARYGLDGTLLWWVMQDTHASA
jgi:hypothetical protein